jgi:hypothetical protein
LSRKRFTPELLSPGTGSLAPIRAMEWQMSNLRCGTCFGGRSSSASAQNNLGTPDVVFYNGKVVTVDYTTLESLAPKLCSGRGRIDG